ncbi:MAG: SUMF1/EgtB/PvdO family nonheme iron enzyme [Gemmataceae bacterium]
MNAGELLLRAIAADPSDAVAWLALADWLEEGGQAERAELLRVHRAVHAGGGDEGRLRGLLAAGVRPAGPGFAHPSGMRFRLIPAGRFLMGADGDDPLAHPDERPRRPVTITRPFWAGVYPVTQAQYQGLAGTNPSSFRPGGRRKRLNFASLPVERVDFADAEAFCRLLGPEYRLPTEAEWEYACRAGTTTRYHFGDDLTADDANANNWQKRPSPVGEFAPNGWGLYDTHGNVWEWTADWYEDGYYGTGPDSDPAGPPGGSSRVTRGGGWGAHPGRVTASCRGTVTPRSRYDCNGFRVVRDFAPAPPSVAGPA